MNKIKNDWISEAEAAKLMGYEPATLRRYAREGKVNIVFTRVNYKTYEYCRNSIELHKLSKSSAIAA
jgi:predicted site-specific integrase-resolvase